MRKTTIRYDACLVGQKYINKPTPIMTLVDNKFGLINFLPRVHTSPVTSVEGMVWQWSVDEATAGRC